MGNIYTILFVLLRIFLQTISDHCSTRGFYYSAVMTFQKSWNGRYLTIVSDFTNLSIVRLRHTPLYNRNCCHTIDNKVPVIHMVALKIVSHVCHVQHFPVDLNIIGINCIYTHGLCSTRNVSYGIGRRDLMLFRCYLSPLSRKKQLHRRLLMIRKVILNISNEKHLIQVICMYI